MSERVSEANPVAGHSGPDLRVYNVVVYLGYVESAKHAPLIFQHIRGFPDARSALLNLHEEIAETLKLCVEWETWREVDSSWYDGPEDTNANIQCFLTELQQAHNDGGPGGYEAWEEMEGRGWSWTGSLVTGVCVTLTENGAQLLSSKTSIINNCDAFEGKKIKVHYGNLIPDLELQVLTVSTIPRKKLE